MSTLQTLPGIGQSSVELLEAAGFLDEASLAKAGLDQLVAELERANAVLKLAKRAPQRSEVQEWIAVARERVGETVADEVEQDFASAPVNYELDPEIAKLLAKAPTALPLSAKILVENEVRVSEIPPAILLNHVTGDPGLRQHDPFSVQATGPSTATSKASKPSINMTVQKGEGPASKRDIDTTRLKNVSEYATTGTVKPASVNPDKQNDRVALLRAPREKTNRGKNPESRRYIRGVLHTHPGQVMFGAFVTLLVILELPLAIAAATLLMLSDMKPAAFMWVPKWFLAFPLALPVCAVFYLIWGVGAGKCRICGQRLFFPKNCRKNSKAHHVKGLGYIVPTALHMLFFRWFRCTYCGTPVRLKE